MNREQATAIAQEIANAFPGRMPPEAIAMFAENLLGLERQPAERAVHELLKSSDRLPTIAGIFKAYYAELRKTGRQSIPCQPCQREVGWRLRPTGILNPPREACPPYDGLSRFTGEDRKDAGPAWRGEAMCAAHGAAYVADLWAQERSRKAQARAQGELPMG